MSSLAGMGGVFKYMSTCSRRYKWTNTYTNKQWTEIDKVWLDMLQLMIEGQDDQLELIGNSAGVLKNMSQQVGNELDEQAVWVSTDLL